MRSAASSRRVIVMKLFRKNTILTPSISNSLRASASDCASAAEAKVRLVPEVSVWFSENFIAFGLGVGCATTSIRSGAT